MNNTSTPCGKTSGFTLLEFIIVIGSIALLSGIVVTRFPGTQPNLNAQAQQLAQDIRYTQSLAMSRGQKYRLNFLSATSYSITDINGNIVTNLLTGGNTVTFTTSVSTGTLTNLPNNLIAFDGRGSPYINSSATTALTSNATIVLTAGGQNRTVTIYPVTGVVNVS